MDDGSILGNPIYYTSDLGNELTGSDCCNWAISERQFGTSAFDACETVTEYLWGDNDEGENVCTEKRAVVGGPD